MAILNRESSRPLYEQLGEIIRQEIVGGSRRVGDRIDSVRHFARTYKLSLFTVQRTIETLSRQGLLRSEKGRGTFVAATSYNITPKTCDTIAFLSAWPQTVLQSTGFFARLVQGLFQASAQAGKDFLCLPPDIGRPLPMPVAQVNQRDVTGVVALAYDTNYFLSLADINAAVVVADCDMSYAGFDSVVYENRVAAYEITNLLIERGARRLCYVGFGRKEGVKYEVFDESVWERYSGFKQALNEHGLPEFANQLLHMDISILGEASRIADILADINPQPDALVVFEDSMGVSIGKALEQRGIVPRRDIAIAGFGESVLSEEASHFLVANARGDESRMGEECIALLLARIEDPSVPIQKRTITMVVIAE